MALSFKNILGEQEIEELFVDTKEPSAEETAEETFQEEGNQENDDTNKTTEVDSESLFEEETVEQPESVGSEKTEVEGKGGSTTDTGGDTSPNENFYSSIANAVAEDGVFPNLDQETVKKAEDAESFSKLFDLEVEARLTDIQKRVKNALEDGVEPDEIRKYEGALDYLAKLTEQQLTEEGERGERIRYNLIYQDYINKGMSPEKAEKLATRSIDSGNDLDDAKEALQSNKDFFQSEYDKLLDNAKKEAEKEKERVRKEADALKNTLLNDKTLMGDIDVTDTIRKKTFDNISKAVYKDPDTGEYLTAIQKYERDNRADFLKYVGLVFTLTDGFKDFNSLAAGKVKREIKKGVADLEKTLNSTKRNSSGSLTMVTSAKEDPESFIGKGLKLDI